MRVFSVNRWFMFCGVIGWKYVILVFSAARHNLRLCVGGKCKSCDLSAFLKMARAGCGLSDLFPTVVLLIALQRLPQTAEQCKVHQTRRHWPI